MRARRVAVALAAAVALGAALLGPRPVGARRRRSGSV